MNRDLRTALFCALLVVACTLATVPVLEMGVNDDWSYTFTARELAATGRLTYNGWAAPILGVQAYWAALFIKLFGFSFTLVRLSTLPLAAGCALLLYALGRRAGLVPALSVFGALTVVLCPVFVPLATSFMTDVPGFFFLLLCFYGCVRALDTAEGDRKGCIGWLTFATLVGVLGGTIRQTVWLGPLALVPYVAWMKRKDRQVMGAASLLWGASALVIAWCTLWFRAQPYAVVEKPLEGLLVLGRDLSASLLVPPLGFTTLLFLLPVLLGTAGAWRSALRGGPVPLALAFLVWIAGPFLLYQDRAVAPWSRNIVTRWGLLEPRTFVIGTVPEVLPVPVCFLLSVLVFGMLAILSVAAVQVLTRRPTVRANEARAPTRSTGANAVLTLLTFFAILYALLLLPRAVKGEAFDRYLIPLLPAVAFPLLLHYQKKVGERLPAFGWALLGACAVYGVATTHDYFASSRARLAAATAIVNSGIPRTQVAAGFEYDAWTELEATGYFNNPRIESPVGAYRPVPERFFPIEYNGFWKFNPSVVPRYFVVLSPQKLLVDAPFPPVPYTTWLPAARRQVLTQMLPPTDHIGN